MTHAADQNAHAEGFDLTAEGKALSAMLCRIAPPPADTQRAAEALLARLPRARSLNLRALGQVTAAAAAALVAAVLLFTGDHRPLTLTPEALPTAAGEVVYAPGPAVQAVVRGQAGDAWLIDAGLKDGLRVGDVLVASGLRARVDAAGIFDSRVTFEGRQPSRGAQLLTQTWTDAMDRAARFDSFGGDPGALFDFGAVFIAMPVHEARQQGFSDGKALRVHEVIRTILREPAAAPVVSLAAQLGLQRGDVIVRVNNAPAGSLSDLGAALGYSRRGIVTATVLREGRALELATR